MKRNLRDRRAFLKSSAQPRSACRFSQSSTSSRSSVAARNLLHRHRRGSPGLAAAYALKRATGTSRCWKPARASAAAFCLFASTKIPNSCANWAANGSARATNACKRSAMISDTAQRPSLRSVANADGSLSVPASGISRPGQSRFRKVRKRTYQHYTDRERGATGQYDWWTWLKEIGFTRRRSAAA